jgi:chromosome segregation ATPase
MQSFQIAPYSRSGNCCGSFHMLPAFLSLAANIATIALVIIFRMPSLVVAPGVGLLFSIHFIYLAHKIQLLDTFAQNNRLLESNVGTLSNQLEVLQATKESLGTEVSQLKQNNKELNENILKTKEQVTELTTLKEKHTSLLAEQGAQVSRLEAAVNEEKENHKKQQDLCNQQKEHIELLAQVGSSHLHNFQTIGKDFTEQFEDKLTRFETGLKDFSALQQVKEEMLRWSQQTSDLVLRDSKFLADRGKQYKQLLADEKELSNQIAVNKALVEATRVNLEATKVDLQDIRSLKEKEAAQLAHLSKEVGHLQTEREKIEEQNIALSTLLKQVQSPTSKTDG